MKNLNNLLQELGISKVHLAKYLGVSRQMVYNYLDLDDISKWPKEKKILLFKLLDINESSDLDNITVNTDYLMNVENRLNQGIKGPTGLDSFINIKNLDKGSQSLLSDLINLIKESLEVEDDKKRKENFHAFKYLYEMLESIDNIPEIKYIFAYMSKATGFTDPKEFKFNEDKQFIFEAILYSAITIYHNGGSSRSKLIDYHKRFEQDIDQKKEEKLSRTAQYNFAYAQALRELGYESFDETNYSEVLEKMAEIESRRTIIGGNNSDRY